MNCSKCGAVSGDDWEQCGGSCPQPASPHFDPQADEAEFELLGEHGEYLAGSSGTRAEAWANIQHYAAIYSQDAPVEIYEVTRRKVEP
jgi:hypothetical protein